MNKTTQFHVWYWVAAFALLTAFQYFYAGSTQIEQIPYSQFETELQAGKIAEVAVSDQYIQGKYKAPGTASRCSSPPGSSPTSPGSSRRRAWW